jgi:DNA repair exonuclease SbcCD ATPase subunit
MRIKELRLKNFKCHKDFTLKPDLKNVLLFGDNEKGKTSVFDAYKWLITDKDSLNQASFEIKPIDMETGEPIHNIETQVTGIFEHDGVEFELSKIFKEVYTTKRGSVEAEFSGHTTDYYYDGVPMKKKDYDQKLSELVDPKIFLLLSDPLYASEQMHWTELRQMLIDNFGKATTEDVLLEDEKLLPLKAILKSRSIEDHIKVLKAQKKKLEDDIDKIPIRIDEVTLSMPDLSGIDFKALEATKTLLNDQIDVIDKSIADTKYGADAASKTRELAILHSKLTKLTSEYSERKMHATSQLKADYFKATDKVDEVSRETIQKGKELSNHVNDEEEVVEKLRNAKIDYEILTDSNYIEDSKICITCGQPLPEDLMITAREKFNTNKSDKLAVLTKNVTEVLRPIRESHKAAIVKLQNDIELLKNKLEQQQVIARETKKVLDTALANVAKVEDTEEHKDLTLKIREVEKSINNASKDIDEKVSKLVSSKVEIIKEMESIDTEISKKDRSKQATDRITELKADKKNLSAELLAIKEQLALTERYTEVFISLVEDNINSQFAITKFKMFNNLVNGGVEPCCIVLYKDVPYTSMNNAARINTGIDIINALSTLFKFRAPIFIDNAEAVTKFIETDSQVIKLIVDLDYDELTEVEI